MSGMISMPEHTIELLQTRHPLHDRALDLYEEGALAEANEAFQQAAEASRARTIRLNEIVEGAEDVITNIARDVAYGRVLLHWALSTEAQFRYDRDDGTKHAALTLALGRASRGLVLLEQDQHKIAGQDEVDAAREIVGTLRDKLAQVAPPEVPAQLPKPRAEFDTPDAEIIELAEAAKNSCCLKPIENYC